MSKDIQDIVILGAGTAGLVAALTIRQKYPTVAIHVVKSSEIGIVGVGEGTTEHWKQFINFVNIDPRELIENTDATVKAGVLFKNWNGPGHEYVHAVDNFQCLSYLNRHDIYNRIESQSTYNPQGTNFELSPFFTKCFYPDRVPVDDVNLFNQYHFDTFKLNTFLTRKCKERLINFVHGTVQDVILDDSGNVKSLVFENENELEGDFFIDASGFKRVIANKLGIKWIPQTQFLPMNRAIAFQTDHSHQESFESYTTATSMKAGWSWKIPTQERYGNGYVYSDEYMTADEALNELNMLLGTNVEEAAREIKFEAGKVEEFWVKNCLCIGLAGSFAEPLEAQSIGFSWVQTKAFIDFFEPWCSEQFFTTKSYNATLEASWANLVSFIQIHYYTKRNDTPFWKDMNECSKLCAGKDFIDRSVLKNIVPTLFNQHTRQTFVDGHIIPDFFSGGAHGYDRYLIFRSPSFYQVFSGLGLLDKQNINSIINQNSQDYIDKIDITIQNEHNILNHNCTTHRQGLRDIL